MLLFNLQVIFSLKKTIMDILKCLQDFENKLTIQRYSVSTIKSYKSVISQFLTLASKK